jgi:hypothetical protein
MPDKCDMRWFKQTFHDQIDSAIEGTPFTLDFLTALACQETGEVWPILRKQNLSVDQILELCVGDTIDFNPASGGGRSAFPKNKAALVAVNDPNGQEMFELAHELLVDMAQFINSYKGAASNPNKFCHGYGIFQFDLQFFLEQPDYFLQKEFADFDKCLAKALGELQSARNKIGLGSQDSLSELELCHVAIAYNTGHFNPAKGLQQGFRPPGGLFYGEQISTFLQTAHGVPVEDDTAPSPFGGNGNATNLKVKSTQLNLRSEPCNPGNTSNRIATLSQGDALQAMSDQITNGFIEVQTTDDNSLRGFAFAELLEPA